MPRKPSGYWTKERCLKVANEYSDKTTFYKEQQVVYKKCAANGWLDEALSHMTKNKRKPWNLEEAKKEALKYTSKIDFVKNSSAYYYARKNNVLDHICEHMEPLKRSWDKKKIIEEAKKYFYRSEFAQNARQAYRIASKENIQEAFSHMAPHENGFSRSAFIEFCRKKGKKNVILYVTTICSDLVYAIGNNIDINFESFVKVGLTTDSVEKRFSKIHGYNIVKYIAYELPPEKAFSLEKEIISSLVEYSYLPKIHFDGKSECFIVEAEQLVHDIVNKKES